MTYRLGRVVEHDARSLAFPAPAAKVVTRTWRHYGPILDQGDLGSCTGNAMAQALNMKPRVAGTRLLTEDDARALYSRATALDSFPGQWPTDDTGSSGLAVAKAARERGWITGYQHAFGLDHALEALMHGPVLLGTPWYEAMFTPAPGAGGFVEAAGDVAGGHEYVLRGVDVRRKVVSCLNSWGPDWGHTGRFYMTFATLERLLSEQGDAVLPVRS